MPTEENVRMKDLAPFATVPSDAVIPFDSPTMGSGHLTPEQIAEYGGRESDRDIFVANYGTPGFDRLVSENNAGRICFVKNSSEGFEEIFQLTEFSENEIAGYSFMKSSDGKVVKKVSVDSDNTWTIGTVDVDDVFFAVYGETSFDELEAAYALNNSIFVDIQGSTDKYRIPMVLRKVDAVTEEVTFVFSSVVSVTVDSSVSVSEITVEANESGWNGFNYPEFSGVKKIVTADDVDDAFSSTSENPVQNKVIYGAIGNVEALLAAL